MSKELNKAPVEQAGGDERKEFEAWMHTFDLPPQLDGETFADERYLEAACFGQFVYDDPLTQRCWAAWQARAALAQPSPVQELDFSKPLETENGEPVKWICADVIEYKSARVCVAKDTGLVYSSPYVGLKIRNVMPEQVEAERPEVVARVVHSNPVVLDHCAPLNANDELMTVAQHAASVARWAEMFNRVEQERDAALARIAELERQEPLKLSADVREFLQEGINSVMGGEDADIDYEFAGQLGKLLDPVYAAPVAQAQHSAGYAEARQCANCRHIGINDAGADGNCPECGGFYELEAQANVPSQAQHSVPEGFREKFKQCMELAFAEIAFYVSPEKARDPNSRARKAGALATELHAMLAAAPGKEVGHE